MEKRRRYPLEVKEQALKEAAAGGTLPAVAQKNGVTLSVLKYWLRKGNKTKERATSREFKKLQEKLHEKEIQIQILKELLKKTNQAWLSE